VDGSDAATAVTEAKQWPLNLGGERDWGLRSEPDSMLYGRSIPFSMGHVLAGGSSINLMIWARGHRCD
jgi:choline dehydrogenase-like flavoprotein